tara:strand:- start:3139 stop:4590 length:1452 start_codon:yes stop_codon:yes gene_type:complete
MNKYSNKTNFLVYNLQSLIVILIPIISIAIFSRIFTPEDYGILALAILFGNITSTLINFGMHNAYETFYFKTNRDEKKDELFNTIIYFNFFLFLLIYFPVNYFIDSVCNFFNVSPDYSQIFLLGYLACNLTTLNNFFLLRTRNEKNSLMNSKIKIGVISIQLFLSIYFVLYLKYGIEGLVFSQLYSNLILFIICITLFINWKKSFNIKTLTESLYFSIPLFPRMITGVVNISYDKFLINLISSAGSLGVYDIAIRISSQCINFQNTLQNTFLPDFYNMANNREINKSKLPKFLMKYFFIAILFCQSISYFSFEIISILTPKDFHEAIFLVTILSLAMSLIFFGTIPILIHLKRTFLISKLSILSLIITLSIVIPLTYSHGVIGTVFGILLSNLINQTIVFLKTYSLFPLEWDFKNILLIYLYLFFSTLLIVYLREIELNYILRLLVKITLIIALIYYGNLAKIFDFKYYFNHVLKKIKIIQDD